ncbi:MAG: hypothetical protein DCF16_11475 [Alphaproteobacteria bacterium]|nr:MAG: hypothetical protein DCF16_11475 [Alphaproteobacteria bacterium]
MTPLFASRAQVFVVDAEQQNHGAPAENFLTPFSGGLRLPSMPGSRSPLKVFVTQIGFHETIVAAHSQRAALEAWGIQRNLFSIGRAYDTRDAAICAVALAAPGQVFARPINSGKPFRLVSAISEGAVTLADNGPSTESK